MRVLYKAIDNYTLTFSRSMILPSETISISPIECIDRQSSSNCGSTNIRIISADEEPELSACSAHSTVSIDTDDETIMTGNFAFPKKHNDKLSESNNMTTTSHSLHDVIRLTYQRNVYPKRPLLRQQIIDDLKQQRIVEEEEQDEVEEEEVGQHEQQQHVSNQENNERDDEEEQEQGMLLLRKKTRNHQEETHQQIQHQSKKNLIKGILVHSSILLQKKREREVSGTTNKKTVHFMTNDNDEIVPSIQQSSSVDISSSFNIYEYRKDLFYSKRELRTIQSKVIHEVKNDIPDIMKELVQSWYKVCSILPSNNVSDTEDNIDNNNNSQNIVDINNDDKVDMTNELQSVAHDWCDTDYRGYEPIILSLLHSQSEESNISLSKFAIPDQRSKLIQSMIRYYKDKKKYMKNQSKKPELLLSERNMNEWNELLREASVSVSKKSVEFALQLAIGDALIVKEFYNNHNNDDDSDVDDDNSVTTILLLEDDLDYMYETY